MADGCRAITAKAPTAGSGPKTSSKESPATCWPMQWRGWKPPATPSCFMCTMKSSARCPTMKAAPTSFSTCSHACRSGLQACRSLRACAMACALPNALCRWSMWPERSKCRRRYNGPKRRLRARQPNLARSRPIRQSPRLASTPRTRGPAWLRGCSNARPSACARKLAGRHRGRTIRSWPRDASATYVARTIGPPNGSPPT
jgi:hypothetical protein